MAGATRWLDRIKDVFGFSLLNWKEPKAFALTSDRYEKRRMPWWVQPLCAIAVVGLNLLCWYLATLNPHKHPLPLNQALPIILTLGLFIAYVFPWLCRLCPAEVRITRSKIVRTCGNSHRIVAFKKITGFKWFENPNQGYFMLQVNRQKGASYFYGVPDSVTRDKVDALLKQVGLKEAVD